MIKIEDYIREDGLLMKKLYSDKGVFIKNISNGYIYASVINLDITADMYEETDQLIEEEDYEVSEQDF
jgi:hypothetical protein